MMMLWRWMQGQWPKQPVEKILTGMQELNGTSELKRSPQTHSGRPIDTWQPHIGTIDHMIYDNIHSSIHNILNHILATYLMQRTITIDPIQRSSSLHRRSHPGELFHQEMVDHIHNIKIRCSSYSLVCKLLCETPHQPKASCIIRKSKVVSFRLTRNFHELPPTRSRLCSLLCDLANDPLGTLLSSSVLDDKPHSSTSC